MGVSVSVTLRVKTGLSRLHIDSSILFATHCSRIEEEEGHLEWPQPGWDKTRSYALASIILAVAALESSVNELYQQAIDGDTNALASLTKEQMGLLEQLWPEVEKLSILKKYQLALTVKNGSGMDTGIEPYQSTRALIALRNGLLHFKPEWDDSLDEHMKLEALLKSYFKPSRLVERLKGSMVWFPHKCLGAGSAIWAGDTVKRFSRNFCNLMGIRARL